MLSGVNSNILPDLLSSPPNRNTPLPTTPRDHRMGTSSPQDMAAEQQRPEPLLSLITATHPLVAKSIESVTSAYNSGKNYSPHLKTGAEYIEEHLSPVAKVVSDVGRRTGVEGGVRWILGGVRTSGRKHQSGADAETGDRENPKRRKAKLSDKEKEAFDRSFPDAVVSGKERRTSVSTVDTLPAYDDHRSPSYAEAVESSRPQQARRDSLEWKARIVVTTSSLAVAMQKESREKLKLCLEQLRYANSCINNMVLSLQNVIEQYDAEKGRKDGEDQIMADASASSPTTATLDNRGRLIAQMNRLGNDIAFKINSVMQFINNHAASALPDNVRTLVRDQFMSLPYRWCARLLAQPRAEPKPAAADQETATREGAHRMLLFAKEGLQMMASVSDVLDRTIKSAEDELARRSQPEAEPSIAQPEPAPSPAYWATTGAQFPATQTAASAPLSVDNDIHMTD